MTRSQYIPLLLITAILLVCAYSLGTQIKFAGASAPSGLPAQTINATSSNPTVTTTASLVFATSSQCSARIVTTPGTSAIMLTFSDNQGKTPTALYGHLQAASTTVAYDSGLYGCGAVKVYSFASQAISVTETK